MQYVTFSEWLFKLSIMSLRDLLKLYVSIVCSFLLLRSIQQYGLPQFFLTIYFLRDILVVSVFWILQIKVL